MQNIENQRKQILIVEFFPGKSNR